MMLFSSDCHAGLATSEYPEYFESAYQDQLAEFLNSENRTKATRSDLAGNDMKSQALREDRERRIVFATQLDKRIPALEEDGFVGEVLFPDADPENVIPFVDHFGGVGDFVPELHAAALRAYNRWLGENLVPDRQLGLALIPLLDPDYAAEQVRSVHARGLHGIVPQWDSFDSSFHPIYDECFDPMWAACAADGLPVNIHGGSGAPNRMYARDRATPQGKMILGVEAKFWCQRPLWHLILGGVLERHPALRVGFVEMFADWIPRTLEYMDWHWETRRGDESFDKVCPRPPSEYWARQCFTGASPMSLLEVEHLDDFPAGTFTYGTDFPHAPSPWGHCREYLQATLGTVGVKEDVARAVLGENIANIYGLDIAKLSAIADRIGPTSDEVLSPPTSEMSPYLKKRVIRPFSR